MEVLLLRGVVKRVMTVHAKENLTLSPNQESKLAAFTGTIFGAACGNHLEKREERPWPTDRDMITKRLPKVATDYEQVRSGNSSPSAFF